MKISKYNDNNYIIQLVKALGVLTLTSVCIVICIVVVVLFLIEEC